MSDRVLYMEDAAAHVIAAATDNGGNGNGVITIRTRLDGPYAEIRVEDTGGGIAAEIRSRVFDLFFTTKEVGQGTGQGLALTQAIVVDKHGGTIDFETEVGRGTTFIVRLPIDGCPPSSAATVGAAAVAAASVGAAAVGAAVALPRLENGRQTS